VRLLSRTAKAYAHELCRAIGISEIELKPLRLIR
jgi:hypothetical protein